MKEPSRPAPDPLKFARVTLCAVVLFALLGVGVVAWFSPQPPEPTGGTSGFFGELQADYVRGRQKQLRTRPPRSGFRTQFQ